MFLTISSPGRACAPSTNSNFEEHQEKTSLAVHTRGHGPEAEPNQIMYYMVLVILNFRKCKLIYTDGKQVNVYIAESGGKVGEGGRRVNYKTT